ncbi:MAG: hypothetical protein RL076_2024 [Chloroflexota bacterium]|jgi:predicted dehydrogenase
MTPIGIGLYGHNGHQLASDGVLSGAHVVAVCDVTNAPAGMTRHPSLPALLADARVQLVVICAPRRATQVDAIRLALRAGKHVIGEKPLVMRHDELDEVIALAHQQGCQLFDMAGIADDAPYAAIPAVLATGVLGEIGQIVVRKSYPYADWRPQDEDVDGGLIMQSGIHAIRLIAHCAGQRMTYVSALSCQVGNPLAHGGLQMAATIQAHLAGGGIASVVLNYYNQRGAQRWGDDELRIYGAGGLIMTDGDGGVQLVTANAATAIVCATQPPYIQRVVDCIRGVAPRPRPVAQDFHATHVVIAARASAMQGGVWLPVPDFLV